MAIGYGAGKIKDALLALGFKRNEFSARTLFHGHGRNREPMHGFATFYGLGPDSQQRALGVADQLAAQGFAVRVYHRADNGALSYVSVASGGPGLGAVIHH